MSKNKILVTGASGMLGSAIVEELSQDGSRYDIYAIKHRKPFRTPLPSGQVICVDLEDASAVKAALEKHTFDAVIHCAALINLATCETEFEAAIRTNVLATKNIVSSALMNNPHCSVVYISSDAVYPDVPGQKSESVRTQPATAYGLSKKWGEDVVRMCTEKALILRTTVIGPDEGQFFGWIKNHALSGKEISLFTDVFFTPISVRLAAKTIVKAIQNEVYGTFNMGSTDQLSKAAFAERILNKLHASCPRKYSSLKDFPSSIKRSLNMALDSSKLMALTGCSYSIDDSINDIFDQLGRMA